MSNSSIAVDGQPRKTRQQDSNAVLRTANHTWSSILITEQETVLEELAEKCHATRELAWGNYIVPGTNCKEYEQRFVNSKCVHYQSTWTDHLLLSLMLVLGNETFELYTDITYYQIGRKLPALRIHTAEYRYCRENSDIALLAD